MPAEWRNLPPEFQNRYGLVGSEYHKIAFDKELARREQAEFIAPAHPLLEAAVEHLLKTADDDLHKGARFTDPTGKLHGWLWFVQVELRDGTNTIATKRLLTVYQPDEATPLRCVNSSVLWDLKPLETAPSAPPCPNSDAVLEYVTQHALQSLRNEITQERMRLAEIKRKYGIRSLDQMLLEVQAKLSEYHTRQLSGEPVPEAEMQNQQKQLEDLRRRRQELEEQIRHETSLLPTQPQVLGVARVEPTQHAQDEMYPDRDIEAIGMQVAMEYERQHARHPIDVSDQNCGYDIRSEGEDGSVRYIEVKARAQSGAIALTPNEWMMAHRLGEEYWLYIVENARTHPTLYTVPNPTASLKAEEVRGVVRYIVRQWNDTQYRAGEECPTCST